MCQLRRPVHLVLDFDATLTVRDTIALLREVPTQRNIRLKREAYSVPEWSSLERSYMEDYEFHQKTEASQVAASNDANPHPHSFIDDAKEYSQMLARRRVVEEQSSRRLEEWNFFRGVTRDDVCKAAETVVKDGRLEMRNSWSELLQMFIPKDGQDQNAQKSKVSIISLNWSTTFIRQCLLGALELGKRDCPELAHFIAAGLEIHSNEIIGLDVPEGSNGRMQSDVHSSADKLKYLGPASQRRIPWRLDRRPVTTSPYLVYVGDSSTDFDCLMAADTGIWLCPADDLRDAQQKCEKCFKPLRLRLHRIEDIHAEPLDVDELVWCQDLAQVALHIHKMAP